MAENIGFTLRLRKRPKGEIRSRVDAVAAMLELGHLLDRLPRELSGGQQQRVALGRALIREPAVFLFDEPFSNLDAALRVRCAVEVKELHQRLGVTSVFVTHDQEEALSLSDRIAIMRAGPHRAGRHAGGRLPRGRSRRYVARFIGSPQMDIFQGRLERRDGALVYAVGSAAFAVPEGVAPAAAVGAELDLGVRPEHVRFNAGGGVALPVRVVQPLGSMTYVTVGWDDQLLTSRLLGLAHLPPGEPVDVSLDPTGLLFFDRASGRRVLADGSLAEASAGVGDARAAGPARRQDDTRMVVRGLDSRARGVQDQRARADGAEPEEPEGAEHVRGSARPAR